MTLVRDSDVEHICSRASWVDNDQVGPDVLVSRNWDTEFTKNGIALFDESVEDHIPYLVMPQTLQAVGFFTFIENMRQ